MGWTLTSARRGRLDCPADRSVVLRSTPQLGAAVRRPSGWSVTISASRSGWARRCAAVVGLLPLLTSRMWAVTTTGCRRGRPVACVRWYVWHCLDHPGPSAPPASSGTRQRNRGGSPRPDTTPARRSAASRTRRPGSGSRCRREIPRRAGRPWQRPWPAPSPPRPRSPPLPRHAGPVRGNGERPRRRCCRRRTEPARRAQRVCGAGATVPPVHDDQLGGVAGGCVRGPIQRRSVVTAASMPTTMRRSGWPAAAAHDDDRARAPS